MVVYIIVVAVMRSRRRAARRLRCSRAQAARSPRSDCPCAQFTIWFVPRHGESFTCGYGEIEISAVDLHAICCLDSHGAGGGRNPEHADEKAVEW